jgi:hypothetical protein
MKARFTAEARSPPRRREEKRDAFSLRFLSVLRRLGGEKVCRYHLFGYEQIVAFAQDCSDKTIKLFSNKA